MRRVLRRRYGHAYKTSPQLHVGDTILTGYAVKTRHTITRIERQKPGMILIYARNESTGVEGLYARVRANRPVTFNVE